MFKKGVSFLLFFIFTLAVYAQSGEISGYVYEEEGDSLMAVYVSLFKNEEQILATYTELDGKYTFVGLDPGSYDVAVEDMSHQSKRVNSIIVGTNQSLQIDFALIASEEAIDIVDIISYRKPLIDKDKQATIITAAEMEDLAVRDISQIAATSVDIVTQDDGNDKLNVRGQRSEGTQFIVDGVKINGAISIPQNAIEQIEIISGGLPAMYGDNIGGVIVVTTKGVSPLYYGGIESVSSQYMDGFGYNLITGNLSGPILPAKRNEKGEIIKKSPLGFFITGEAKLQEDARPSSIGAYMIKEDVLLDLENNPLRAGLNGTGTMRNSEFVTSNDFEKYKARQNVANQDYKLNAKIDFQPNDNISITVGGNGSYSKKHDFVYEYSLFNPSNNPEITNWKYNGFVRFKHRINTDSIKWLSNLYYQIQTDYMWSKETTWDDTHKDNFFKYGHVGKFKTTRNPLYEYESGGVNGDAYYYKGEKNILYELVDPGSNPNASKYAEQYYEIYAGQSEGNYENWTQVQNGGALLNGDRPENVYGLWFNTGRQYNSYEITENEQFRGNVNLSAKFFKNHQVNFGVEHEQRIRRSYSLNPIRLWTAMRLHANSKNTQLDLANPDLVYSGSVFLDTVNYSYLYEDDVTGKGFFENVRDQFGMGYSEFFDSDAYGPNDYSLALFTPDELYQEGNGVLTNYGYDHLGNKIGSKNLDAFFNQKDGNGNLLRDVSPFQPIYSSGYIQDKFEFKDIIFNIGLRIDRYDANQPVLKDAYSLYETYTVRDLDPLQYTIPSAISDEAVVYVNDFESAQPTILGYRLEDKWFDKNGFEISDPADIAEGSVSGGITPYLKNPAADITSSAHDPKSSFKDYEAQISIMPRISFTFNLSERASFYAHYDVLTQRPGVNESRFMPTDYLFMESNVGGFIRNPNLKPQKTIDYEVGFQQALNEKSAITISTYFREMKDLIQLMNVSYAYPSSYLTYGNIDRATVKGFSIKYDLRPIYSNLSLNVGYTLQFAEGTGSSAISGFNLASQGLPNLKVLVPLDFDQRHTVKAILNYRFLPGKKYIGPDWNGKGRKVLGGFGMNFVGKLSSGRPYTGQENYTQNGAIGSGGISILDGTINGNRLPWIYTVDMRMSKKFVFGFEKEARDKFHSEIYLVVTNLFNTKNMIAVYTATGNADDDGYLNAATSQSDISTQTNTTSYKDLYLLKIADPSFYALPRMIKLGLTLNF
jgi:outer membrane receptor protein involved in Fe transport